MILTCNYCDKTFETNGSRRKNCSNECRYASIRKYPWTKKQKVHFHMFKFRYLAVKRLGGKCNTCGYNENYLGLDIDHINNNGKYERDYTSKSLMYSKIMNGDIEDYQLLCGTCHYIKTRHNPETPILDFIDTIENDIEYYIELVS